MLSIFIVTDAHCSPPSPPCDWSDDAGNNLLGLSWAAQVARFGQHRVAVNEF